MSRGLIALLGVLIAGPLADETVQLRRGGVSTLVPLPRFPLLRITNPGDAVACADNEPLDPTAHGSP